MRTGLPATYLDVLVAGSLLAKALLLGTRYGWDRFCAGAIFGVVGLQPLVSAGILAFVVPTSRRYLLPVAAGVAGLGAAAGLAWHTRAGGDPFFLVAAAQFYVALPVFLLGVVFCSHRNSPGQERLFRGSARVALATSLFCGTLAVSVPTGSRLLEREVANAKRYTEAVAQEVLRESSKAGHPLDDIATVLLRVGDAPILLAGPGGLDYEPGWGGFQLSFVVHSELMTIECWTYHCPERRWTYWRD
jgi:hypothetical protein